MDSKPNDNLIPYNVSPHDGYVAHQSEKGDALPNCCSRHRKIFDDAKKWARTSNSEKDAIKFALKTVFQVAYTEHCILKCISYENAYEIISGFIEYNVFSFGSRKDYQPYIFGLFGFTNPDGPDDFRFGYEATLRVNDIILMWYKTSLMEVDIYMLRETFKKWYDIFPFELSIFKGLKENYDFFYEMVKNDLGDFTPESFTEELSSLTESILSQINTLTLFEEGVLDEPSKLKLEFIINERRLKLSIGHSTSDSNGPVGYERILKKWFKDEKKFIDEIAHLIKPEIAEPEISQPEVTQPEIAQPEIAQFEVAQLEVAQTEVAQTEVAQTEKMIDEVIESIWEQLRTFKFPEYLLSKGKSEDMAMELFLKHKGVEFVPYCMAFFHVIGFEKYFFENHCKNKEDGFKKLSQIFRVSLRNIKGNVNVLGPRSEEDKTRYTSGIHLSTVSKELQGV